MSKVLFILKRREDYNATVHKHVGLSTGLYNSASFVHNMLESFAHKGIRSKLVVVTDNNDIDREVSLYKPTHVIIEALWVVPSKFDILQKLHPNVEWLVRLHSEMPFMANEGIAMDWIGDYVRFKKVKIAINAKRMLREIRMYVKTLGIENPDEKVIYLPNYYPQSFKHKRLDKEKDYIDIGCFGAVRPLKNTLIQAIACIDFANRIGKKLRFHINAGRIEMKGEPNVHNLQGLFEQLANSGHELINHTWTPREDFLKLCAKMDIGIQVSFTETFNIVACDLLTEGVPVIGSSEIPWMSSIAFASPVDSEDIVEKLYRAYHFPTLNVFFNKYNLNKYLNKTKKIWFNYFK